MPNETVESHGWWRGKTIGWQSSRFVRPVTIAVVGGLLLGVIGAATQAIMRFYYPDDVKVYVHPESTAGEIVDSLGEVSSLGDRQAKFDNLYRDRWIDRIVGRLRENPGMADRPDVAWFVLIEEQGTGALVLVGTQDEACKLRRGYRVEVHGRVRGACVSSRALAIDQATINLVGDPS